ISPGEVAEVGVPIVVTSAALDTSPSAVHIEVFVNGLVPGSPVLVDRVMLMPTQQITTPYYDGSLPGAAWEGARSASPSTWNGVARWVPSRDFSAIEETLEQAEQKIADAISDIEFADA